MKKLSKNLLKIVGGLTLSSVIMIFCSIIAFADNPIIQTNYTADPAPMLYNDTVYLYTTHDADETRYGFFSMTDWKCYSTKDMVNWTDHGTIFGLEDISWSHKGTAEKPWEGSRAWAAQCIERDGKFYLYVPVRRENGGMALGVGISDNPEGPFTDPLDIPLVDLGGWDEIDPTIYVDDDGEAYLYWGNPTLKCVMLNEDMISVKTEEKPEFRELNEEHDIYTFTLYNATNENRNTVGVYTFKMKTSAFGDREGGPSGNYATSYEEGPWFHKRGDLYYMVFAGGPLNPNEHVGYSTSDTPIGPWEYQGRLMEPGGAFTIHPGIIEYKGRSFLFYHNNALPGGAGFKRSVCMDEFSYNEDGTIPPGAAQTNGGPLAVATLNPYTRTEAETIAWTASTRSTTGTTAYESHVKTEFCDLGGMNIRNVRNGNYIKVKDIDFGEIGAEAFSASVSCDGSESAGGTIEIRLDSLNGQVIGELSVSDTGGWNVWEKETAKLDSIAKGTHDLFFVFKGGAEEDLLKMDYWQFQEVVIPATAITVSPDSLTLKAGESGLLKATAVPANSTNRGFTWSSSNPAVAEVDAEGKVQAKAPGTAIITAEAQDGSAQPKKGSCTVAVIKPITGITISPKTLSLAVGGQQKLSAALAPADATNKNVEWTSSNPSVATVEKDGTVKATGVGTATITAQTQDGSKKSDTCVVTVVASEYKITYQLNGGQNHKTNPNTYNTGASVTLKAPSRAKYTFGGWYSDSAFKKKVTRVSSGNITLYAKWVKVKVARASIKSLKNNKSKRAKLVVNLIKTSGIKYEALYAKNANFTKEKKKTVLKGASKTVKRLEKGQTYYFKVRAYKLDSTNKKVYGKYSKKMKVVINK